MWLLYPVRLHHRKLILPLHTGASCRKLLGQGWDPFSTFPSQTGISSGLKLCRLHACCQSLPVNVCISFVVSRNHCSLESSISSGSDIPSVSYSTLALSDLRGGFHEKITFRNLFIFCILSSCGLAFHNVQGFIQFIIYFRCQPSIGCVISKDPFHILQPAILSGWCCPLS